MDAFEERQIQIYELGEQIKEIKSAIDDEQYTNATLHQKRSILSYSITKNVLTFAYILFFYGALEFMKYINSDWQFPEDNPVLMKLTELAGKTYVLMRVILILLLIVAFAFIIRKLYIIWFHSERPAALHMAEQM